MDLPKYKQSSRTGENGITILKGIVETQLEWIFRPNHQEHDFGIDAYIDIVSDAGEVTGKTIAIQVKTGQSYFNERSKFGWIYRGRREHLNLYLNQDIPVVIILVDDSKQKVYWCYCDANKTTNAGDNWKITIPYNQELNKESKDRLLQYVSPVKDYVSPLNRLWVVNEMLTETTSLTVIVDKSEIRNLECQSLILAMERLRVTNELIEHAREKVDIVIQGYDQDVRELFEIPEVNEWIEKVFYSIQGWAYFLYKGERTSFFKVLMLSQIKHYPIEGSEYIVNGIRKRKVRSDYESRVAFIEYLLYDLDQFCKKHDIDEGTNFEVKKNTVKYIFGDIPESWKR